MHLIIGSILVEALIVAVPTAPYLLTDHLLRMLGLSTLIVALGAISGYWLAALWMPRWRTLWWRWRD